MLNRYVDEVPLLTVCPLDSAHHIELVESVPVKSLVAAARRDLGLDVSEEFTGLSELGRFRCRDCSLSFFDPPVVGGAQFYAALLQQPWYQPAGKFEHAAAAQFIERGQRVLDIGCGDERFRTYVPGVRYTGVDEYGEQQLGTLGDETFDCVCAFQVLEHVATPATFIAQALARLRPGGLLMLGVPNMSSYLEGLMNFALNAPPHHVTGWRVETFSVAAKQFGLEPIACLESPLERWETALYWMGRHYAPWVADQARFSAARRWSLLIPFAYLAGKLRARLAAPPMGVRGSTLLWVARKPNEQQLSRRLV